jgi:tight adherence protein B
MRALAWLALAAALIVAPLPASAGHRVAGLVGRGRLAVTAGAGPRLARRQPRAPAVAVLGCAVASTLATLVGGVSLGVAAAVFTLTGGGLLHSAAALRRDARGRRDLLAAVRLMVAELDAGSAAQSALLAAGALTPHHAPSFAAAADAAESGGDPAAALCAGGAAALEPLAHAWRVGALSGAPLATVLGRVAADLADHDNQHREVAVALAGPRSSGLLLAGLPVVGVGLGTAMGARPVQYLLGTPGGRLLCCVGVVLDAAGVFWTQRLMRRAERG